MRFIQCDTRETRESQIPFVKPILRQVIENQNQSLK